MQKRWNMLRIITFLATETRNGQWWHCSFQHTYNLWLFASVTRNDQQWCTINISFLTHHKQTMSTVKLIFKEKLNRRCRLAWKMCRYFHLHASFGSVTIYTKDVLSSEFKLSRLSHVFIKEKQNKVGLWQLRLLSCMLALSILSLTWHKMAAHIVVFSWLNFFFFFF